MVCYIVLLLLKIENSVLGSLSKSTCMCIFSLRFVFFLEPCNVDLVRRKIKSIALCVSSCPRSELKTLADVQKFADINGKSNTILFLILLKYYLEITNNTSKNNHHALCLNSLFFFSEWSASSTIVANIYDLINFTS